jgi:dihydrofolate reductase
MRKIKLAMYVSIDDVFEDPGWTMPFWNDELAKMQSDWLFSSDALLLGRVTYESFASHWPKVTDNEGFADRMNSMPKYVVSKTLQTPTWNASIAKGNVNEEVSKLRRQPGSDLLIYGSGQLVTELTRHGLIDRYRLMVHPVVVGTGRRLFDGVGNTTMRLTDHKATKTGVVVLDFERAA